MKFRMALFRTETWLQEHGRRVDAVVTRVWYDENYPRPKRVCRDSSLDRPTNTY